MLKVVENIVVEGSWDPLVVMVEGGRPLTLELGKSAVPLDVLESDRVVSEIEVGESLELLVERALDTLDKSSVCVLEIKLEEVVVVA